jgi:hypothetical protein
MSIFEQDVKKRNIGLSLSAVMGRRVQEPASERQAVPYACQLAVSSEGNVRVKAAIASCNNCVGERKGVNAVWRKADRAKGTYHPLCLHDEGSLRKTEVVFKERDIIRGNIAVLAAATAAAATAPAT